MILYVPPHAPLLVRDAAALVLALHIGGGSLAVVSGAAALTVRKGSAWHRAAGHVFTLSMLAMGGIGAVVSPFLPTPQPANVIAGALACYLAATGWAAVRRQTAGIGRLDYAALLIALTMSASLLTLGVRALLGGAGALAGVPYPVMFVLAAIFLILAAADLSVILRRGLVGPQRVARHLWRMSAGLLLATASALGQPKIFDLLPAPLGHFPIFLTPIIAILAVMIYWLVRLRRTDRRRLETLATAEA